VCKALHTAGYYYVENLTWVLMAANNSILRLEHPYTCKSHLTLLIFRKEGEQAGGLCCAVAAGWEVLLLVEDSVGAAVAAAVGAAVGAAAYRRVLCVLLLIGEFCGCCCL
jgi:hypothetical protein